MFAYNIDKTFVKYVDNNESLIPSEQKFEEEPFSINPNSISKVEFLDHTMDIILVTFENGDLDVLKLFQDF